MARIDRIVPDSGTSGAPRAVCVEERAAFAAAPMTLFEERTGRISRGAVRRDWDSGDGAADTGAMISGAPVVGSPKHQENASVSGVEVGNEDVEDMNEDVVGDVGHDSQRRAKTWRRGLVMSLCVRFVLIVILSIAWLGLRRVGGSGQEALRGASLGWQ